MNPFAIALIEIVLLTGVSTVFSELTTLNNDSRGVDISYIDDP